MKTKVNFKILITLGIMLLAVFVFNMNTVNAESKQEVQAFNAQFEVYADQPLHGSNVKALINVVKVSNESAEYKVKINKELSEITASETYGVILKYDKSGRVNEIIIDQNIVYAEMTIINSAGEMVVTFIPQFHSGGGSGYINTKADYSNCLFAIAVQNNYGQSFETTLGTFTYTDKYSDLEEYMSGRIYTCPVKMSDIVGKKDKLDLVFSATNVDTNEKETVNAHIYIFTPSYKQNANLKVGNKNFVSEGKVIENVIYIQDSDTFAGYDEINNVLRLYNYTGKIVYSDMGSTFKIEKDEKSNVEIICEDKDAETKPSTEIVTTTDPKTDIKLEAQEGTIPKNTIIEVATMTEGEKYYVVKRSLYEEVNKFKMYDIRLKANGTIVQPKNGKVKISIPIPPEFNKSKSTNYAVYRSVETSEGTTARLLNYPVTIEGNYVTFETDHFSIYVLAELKDNNSSQGGTTNTTKPQDTTKPVDNNTNAQHKKDDTPKTGTIDIIGYVVLATVVAGAGIVALKKRETK